jgi:hypothetical protein
MLGIPFGLNPATKISITRLWYLRGENNKITFANAQAIHIAVHAATKNSRNDTGARGKKTSLIQYRLNQIKKKWFAPSVADQQNGQLR